MSDTEILEKEKVVNDKQKVISETLRILVHYIAADKPFKDDSASRDETVGHLKKRVLDAFGLTEGQTPDGNSTTYTLHYKKTPLDDPNQTLGNLAGDKRTLEFKLVQQIIQG